MKQLSLTFLLTGLCFVFTACKKPAEPEPVAGLVAYYDFTKGVKDVSGNNNTAQIVGATPTADRFGTTESAYAFNGSSYIELPPDKFATDEFTYAAWVKLAYVPQTYGVFTILDTGNYQGDHAMVLANTTVLGWGMWSYTEDRANFNFAYSGSLPTNTNQWYHILASRSKNKLNIYVNGVLSSSQAMTGKPFYEGSVRTLIGKRFDGSFSFSGAIDDVRIYNRALSDVEAKRVYEMN
ncbi:LamG domain-containing protein [Spirosoma pulveris]